MRAAVQQIFALEIRVVLVPAVMFWHLVSAVGRPHSFSAGR